MVIKYKRFYKSMIRSMDAELAEWSKTIPPDRVISVSATSDGIMVAYWGVEGAKD